MVAFNRTNIPAGKFRVLGCDLFDHTDYVVEDCDDRGTANVVADTHNRTRTGPMDDAYHVYDDKGEYLRGPEAIKNAEGEIAMGVSP